MEVIPYSTPTPCVICTRVTVRTDRFNRPFCLRCQAEVPPEEEIVGGACPTLEMRFNEMADRWEGETLSISDPSAMVELSVYKDLVTLGKSAVPFALRRVEEGRSVGWFSYLADVVGEDHGAGQEMVEDAARAWLTWGREAGLLLPQVEMGSLTESEPAVDLDDPPTA